MSHGVIADPDDLKRFARELKTFNTGLGDAMTQLQGQFVRLGDTWRDQEHQKFGQEFEQTMRVLNHFMQSSEQQVPLLQGKARKLRDYLRHR